MAKTKKDPADALFKGQSEACKRLHAESKKALREKARKEWWREHGK